MSDEEESRSGSPAEGSFDDEETRRRDKGRLKRPRIADPDEEEDDDVKPDDDVNGTNGANGSGRTNGDADDAVEEEDDEEEDEEEDDEDDEEEVEEGGERRKKRRRKQKKFRFLDVEAEVDDEDDEDEEGDDFADVAEFIDEVPDEAAVRDDQAHRTLDRRRGEEQMESVEETVARLKERYGRQQMPRYDPDSDQVPQRLLMPGVNDPSLYLVRVKPGQEESLITKIFRKVFAAQYSANPFEIFSAFYRDSLPGHLFVEARAAAPVTAVLTGLIGVYLATPIKLVPIEEMAPLLKIKKQEGAENVQPGMWVRMRRGKYQGDLAQVVDVESITSGVAAIKFIPRIDLTPKERRHKDKANGKTLGGNARPPARLFAPDEVRRIYGRGSVKSGAQGSLFFENDEFIDGFCIKDVKFNIISLEDVKPTLEEVSRFTGEEGSTSKIDLAAIENANKNISASGLFPGDKVSVYEGEQSGLEGVVETVTPDIIAIKATNGDVHGQVIEVSSRSVRKRFEVGEHVKVLHGPNKDASGMVVAVAIKEDVVTILSDQGEQEIKAFSKDIRRAADIAGSSSAKGLFDLHDMVMLDSATAAVIIKVEGAMLRVMDQNGTVKVVTPQEITARRENKQYAVAQDANGNEMKVGDAMKESAGENRTGEVINIFRSLFVFLFSREMLENYGVFVARASSLVSVTPKQANDLSKLNPLLNSQLPYGGASLMPPPSTAPNKSRLVNTPVVVVKGTQKGLMGMIRDILGDKARVEMSSNNKILTIDISSLKKKDPKTGQTMPLDFAGPGGFGARNGAYDTFAPMPNSGGATPSPYGGRTPAARFGQTPNPYASGGYGLGGKTPNPYAAGTGGRTPAPGWSGGGKTPGWAGTGGRTPAPGAHGFGGDGGKTPGWAGMGGGKTPNPYAAGAAAGGRTPAPANSMYHDPGTARPSDPISAPTPYNAPPTTIPVTAPTPAAVNPYSAPTPFNAPTPYSAPTPYGAPTPAALSAPTPAPLGGFGAGTPYGAPTPFVPGGPAGPAIVEGTNGLPWDWVLDFRNLVVEVGKNSNPSNRLPLHFQRGAYDNQQFGYSEAESDVPICTLISDQSMTEKIPPGYLRPARPTAPGQLCVVVNGPQELKGQQRTTDYSNEDQWMMVLDEGDVVPMIVPRGDLCRIWRT